MVGRSDRASAGRSIQVLPSAARTASGDSGELPHYGGVSQLVVQLDVTAADGVTPTLDVVLQDTVDGTNYHNIATFPQATAAARSVMRIETPFTDRLQVRWVMAGATPSFTFSVSIYSE